LDDPLSSGMAELLGEMPLMVPGSRPSLYFDVGWHNI
jgi:hypothetical protein